MSVEEMRKNILSKIESLTEQQLIQLNNYVESMNYKNDRFNRYIRWDEICGNMIKFYAWLWSFTGTSKKCLNLVSYNYLGFSENRGPRSEKVLEAIKEYGSSTGAVRHELGTISKLVHDLINLNYLFTQELSIII